ncbi:hypothetical protein GXW83_01895 [Streptacidiphilus sp. PB12-B1b]|uniref:hypothetical protein n=1 Tax=Streptacidiphilus sp. PB12-B1b TaxID=2705012 RepID=UPI0015FA7C25|nr:hypothetical protein [Streptacidiphilus sp. PB12-B1b]QMU74716.1 hypothetical protein GXW83_01895 [Streptacidiphilus sp. PB12-B1b]
MRRRDTRRAAEPLGVAPNGARTAAIRAGQLLVLALITTPIALLLAGLCLGLVAVLFTLLGG